MNKLLPFNMPPISKSGMLGMLSGAGGAGGAGAFWKLLGSTKLGSAGDSIEVASFADMPYLMVQYHIIPSGNLDNIAVQFEGDSATNYAYRVSTDGGASSQVINNNKIRFRSGGAVSNDFFGYFFMINDSSKEKLTISDQMRNNTNGAGNAPSRAENAGKWANTSDSVTTLEISQDGSGSFNTNSEVVVLGYDPDDTSGTSVYEELANETLTGTGNLSSGTITAKKYLWVQIESEGVTSGNDLLRFNDDSASNYSDRKSADGGTDATRVNQTSLVNHINEGGRTTPSFANFFIINDSDYEKLLIGNVNQGLASGSGVAPSSLALTGKWANTSDAITNITLFANEKSDSSMIVYGFDP